MKRRGQRTESGSYLVMAAFILTVLMITGAMAIDVVRKYRLEQSAQDVADAAALAGARQLPDATAARTAAIRYIQQYGSDSYVPGASDIQIAVSSDNQSGTCGVIVYGAWDAIFMPMWLTGDPQYGISRYAMATMRRTMTQNSVYVPGDMSSPPNGDYALFVGDTVVASALSGNSIRIVGDAHFNDNVSVSGHSQNLIDGTFEAVSGSGGGGITIQQPCQVEAMPQINAASLVYDVLLDQNNAAQKAYYAARVPLVATNGVAVPNAYCQWDAANSRWVITNSTGTSNVTTYGNSTLIGYWGNGIDVKVVGDLELNLPNGGGSHGGDPKEQGGAHWDGSFQVSGTVTIPQTNNNTELHGIYGSNAIAGKDNPGLAVYAGASYNASQTSICVDGNMTCWYGVVYTPGKINWTGNFNNYHANDQGTSGNYDATGNGFVKGSIICGSFSADKQNFQVYYDAAMTEDFPITNSAATTPPRYSTPRITLIK